MKKEREYRDRKLIRFLEIIDNYINIFFNKLTTSKLNPLYRTGELLIALIVILSITGIILLLFYRPGIAKAFDSVSFIHNSSVLGTLRKIHIISGQALLLVSLLHALRYLILDRAYGARFFTWLTGWPLFFIIWVTGIIGYWLVWNQKSQTITDHLLYLLGPKIASSFLTNNADSQTFAFFVILLFIHAFVPIVLLFGLFIHQLRLSRATLLPSPYFFGAIFTAVTLIAVFSTKYTVGEKADFHSVVEFINADIFLSYIPLLNNKYLGIAVVVAFIILILIPRLYPLTPEGVARVLTNCTGCSICFQECPFEAIQMIPTNSNKVGKIAQVNSNLCVTCGICVGSCGFYAIELEGQPIDELRRSIRVSLKDTLRIIYTCQRIAFHNLGIQKFDTRRPIIKNDNTVTVVLPCVGSIHPNWLEEDIEVGAKKIDIISCPDKDCRFREGVKWFRNKLKKRASKLTTECLHNTYIPGYGTEKKYSKYLFARATVAIGIIFFASTFNYPLRTEKGAVGLRIVARHLTRPKTVKVEKLDNIEGKVVTGTLTPRLNVLSRYPLTLKVVVDGKTVLLKTYDPSGIKDEGVTFVSEKILLPKIQRVSIFIKDGPGNFREAFNADLYLKTGEVVIIRKDQHDWMFRIE